MKKQQSINTFFNLFWEGIHLLKSVRDATIWLNAKQSRSHRFNDLL